MIPTIVPAKKVYNKSKFQTSHYSSTISKNHHSLQYRFQTNHDLSRVS